MDAKFDEILSGEETDKVEEYFRLKKVLKELRADLKDLKTQHEDTEELNKLNKKVKDLRDKIKEDEDIKILSEKVSTVKERQDLIKEIVRGQLLENAQDEVKRHGRKLKLVYVLKELNDDAE